MILAPWQISQVVTALSIISDTDDTFGRTAPYLPKRFTSCSRTFILSRSLTSHRVILQILQPKVWMFLPFCSQPSLARMIAMSLVRWRGHHPPYRSARVARPPATDWGGGRKTLKGPYYIDDRPCQGRFPFATLQQRMQFQEFKHFDDLKSGVIRDDQVARQL